ncbi:maltose acetyltransferase domain-containing protein [Agrobacterium sp. P15N1-A]|uniref:maltose acetyltransferase domain-containing protein n=1 Tax=Agrobacterium sp. P15N1-A TaxID=3342820 RepID=UPI0037D3C842
MQRGFHCVSISSPFCRDACRSILSTPFEGRETMSTEREKMAAGEWYSCMDAELDILRWRARGAVHQHNTMPPDGRGGNGPLATGSFRFCW